MEINIKWNICRICLTEEEKKSPVVGVVEPMRHIFQEDELLAKQIYECSGITMKPNDNLPEKICKKCSTLLKYAVGFRKACRASAVYLHSILQRTKSATSLFNQEQPPTADFLEENISNESISCDNILSEIAETDPLIVVEQLKTLKPKGTHLEKTIIKLCKDSNSSVINSNSDNLIEHRVEEDANEIKVNNAVEEEEEMTDAPESRASQKLSNRKQDIYIEKEIYDQDGDEVTEIEPKSEYFQINEVDNDDNLESKTDIHNYKEHAFHFLEKNKTESIANQQSNQQEEAYEQGIEKIETYSQHEMFQNLERHDNQSQVSSTVLANADEDEDIIELLDENSRLSTETNEMQAEYIIDEYLVDDSNSDISTGNSNLQTLTFIKNKNTKTFTNNCSSSKTSSPFQVWICELCGNHFTNRLLLNAHMKVHRQEKKHECEICSKRFITACNLQAHMRVHTGEKPFECQYCKRRFSDRSSNLRHERTHTNEKPFECKECGKAFSLSTTLKKHLKVHTEERLYRCDICAKSFKLIHQLKAHKNTTLHKAIEQLVEQDQ